MNSYVNTIFSVLIVVTGVCVGYLLYKYVVKTQILEPSCLLNTNTCIKIMYYVHGNSVLFHAEPNGYWGWFDGDSLYIYDYSLTSQKCPNGTIIDENGSKVEYQSAYKIPRVPTVYSTSTTNEIVCIETVSSLIQYYENLKVKKRYLYDRVPQELISSPTDIFGTATEISVKLDIRDLMNILEKNKIIKVNKE